MIMNKFTKQPPSATFPSPSGGAPPLGHPWHAVGASKFSRVMRIPNMCLVLKLDNGKVVSIADEQIESQSHPVPY